MFWNSLSGTIQLKNKIKIIFIWKPILKTFVKHFRTNGPLDIDKIILEPRHEKTCLFHIRKTKVQISCTVDVVVLGFYVPPTA